jgi:2C-methyl-D-erythritol 2,4-cyclodiphosphate synthase
MPLPNESVTLSAAQIRDLNQELADLRHDLNNSLSLMTAAVELIKRRPENAGNMWDTLIEQPRKLTEAISQFSRDFETALHITKP